MIKNISYSLHSFTITVVFPLLILLLLNIHVDLSSSQVTQNGGYSAYGKYAYDAFFQRIRIGELINTNNKTLIKDVLLLFQEVKHTQRNQTEKPTHVIDIFYNVSCQDLNDGEKQ